MRIIFHIDVNNAFLSWTAVDLLKQGYKDIRLVPSCIGGDETSRKGIVVSRSDSAKKAGVKAAISVYEAKKICPNLEVYPHNFELYIKNSQEFYNYLSQYTPIIEQYSVDECFLDLTNTNYLYKDYIELAYKIKDEIYSKFGYTVNVGIGNNKLCAKMASDFEKPNKVHTLWDSEIDTKMYPLPVDDLLYCGKSSCLLLHRLGINTIGDLANCSSSKLEPYFKNRTLSLINSARGIDDSEVITEYGDNKSISISRTFDHDLSDFFEIKNYLLDYANIVGLKIRKKNLYTKTICITIKDNNFKSFSHQKAVSPTNSTLDIYNTLVDLYFECHIKNLIRALGVRISNFIENDDNNINKAQEVLDKINDKYNGNVIMPAIYFENNKKNG